MTSDVAIYWDIVRDSARRTGRALAANPIVLVIPVALAVGSRILERALWGQRSAESIAAWILGLAVFSSWLYFLRELVQGKRVSLTELPRSMVEFIGDFFAPMLFAAALAVGSLAISFIVPCLGCLFAPLVLLCNPSLEVLYSGRSRSLGDFFQACVDFLRRNFWPWLAFNALLVFVVAPVALGASMATSLVSYLWPEKWREVIARALEIGTTGPLVFIALTLRGFVFTALAPGSHRTRMFQARARSEVR